MQFHKYADLFPMMDDAALKDLAADIKSTKQHNPIWLFEGKILDGRNRYRACSIARVKPFYSTYRGEDPISFVLSQNQKRRHMNDAQLAELALKVAVFKRGDNQHASTEASSQTAAAEAVGVSRSTVQRMKKITEEGSKALKDAVVAGEVSLSKAAQVLDEPKPKQLAAAKKPTKKPKPVNNSPEPNLDPGWRPEPGEAEHLEKLSAEADAAIEKIMKADDKLAAAHAEIKRQDAEIKALKISRDGYMNERREIIKRYKALQKKVEGLERKLGAKS